ncbi:MAG: DNA double-strand break repair nuclease NurA [Chloroflexota bacterium]|nr:DNA double-strand break repair nuclease NurA [Chloroflexota bacterium]MBI5705134.1 DNA double-strand break repair nuclease NurA [Chloroflexota bacterium]
MPEVNNTPFAELPAALVDEVLIQTKDVSQRLLSAFGDLKTKKETWRSELFQKNLIHKQIALPFVNAPTTCGVDGSMAIERLLALDLVAVGAVAVEGLTPPSEARYWPEPRHLVYVNTEIHHADTGSVLQGIMAGNEMQLAKDAPHEVVFLDGSLTTPTIFFNQALSKIAEAPYLRVSKYLLETALAYLESYRTILQSTRSDHFWVAMPKYTTRREIGELAGWHSAYEDRGILSLVMEPGEYTHPMPLTAPETPWHINISALKENKEQAKKVVDEIIKLLNGVKVIYYRPVQWWPALRLELAQSIADNPSRLSIVLKGIEHQCQATAIMEPFPLYMADRMVKHLARSIPVFRQIASQNLAENYDGDIGEVFMSLHGYRTETGA